MRRCSTHIEVTLACRVEDRSYRATDSSHYCWDVRFRHISRRNKNPLADLRKGINLEQYVITKYTINAYVPIKVKTTSFDL